MSVTADPGVPRAEPDPHAGAAGVGTAPPRSPWRLAWERLRGQRAAVAAAVEKASAQMIGNLLKDAKITQ